MEPLRVVPTIIVQWTEGFNSKPRWFFLAETDEDVEKLEQISRRPLSELVPDKIDTDSVSLKKTQK